MSTSHRSVRLSEVCRFQNGGTPSKSIERYFTGDIPWITGADLVGSVALQARSLITKEAVASSATNQVPAGTVLLVTRTSVGKVAIAGMDLCFSQDITALTPDAESLNAEYLVQFLRTKQEHFAKHARGATIQGITRQVVADLALPLPPLEEQRRIAAILDQAETLRTQRRAALTQLDSLTQSLFLDMFGDPAADDAMWSMTPLEDVAELVTGYPFRSEEYVGLDEGIKLCRGANVLPGRLDWRDMACWPHAKVAEVEAFHLQAGDIVMAMDRPWISEGFKLAQVDAADCPMLLVQRVARIRPKSDVTNEYLFAVLSHAAFTRHCKPTETTVPHISPKDIRSFAFPLPPLALQQTFATRIQAIEALKITHRAALFDLDALFASLQQCAFSGELTQSTSVVQVEYAKARDFSELCKLDADKGLEALIYVARRMPEHHFYKALKALYFADKHQLENQGRLIYGETHCALPMGPVPQAAYDAAKVLSGELLVSAFDDQALRASLRRTDKELIPLRDADPAKLSAEERESLDWAIRYVAPMSFDQVKTASHDSAYERTPRNQPIQLAHIIEMFPEPAKKRFFAKT